MKNILYTLLIASVVFATSCKKDDEVPQLKYQSLSFKFQPYSGSDALNYSSTFTNADGRNFTLTEFRYYVSGIKLIKEDGSELPITNKYLLVSPSTSVYPVGDVPAGNYKGIKFSVGVDYDANHGDPTLYAADHPLAIQSPGIHWSWMMGYIFMKIEGTCDTSATGTAGEYHDMFYHIGMDSYLTEVDLSTSSFSVSGDSPKQITFKTDVNVLLEDVDMETEWSTHTMDNMPLATRIKNNIPDMFTVVP